MKDIFIRFYIALFILVFLILQLVSLFYKIDAFSCLLGAGLVSLCYLFWLNLK